MIHKNLETFQNDLVDKHYEEVDTMYQTMRAWKHDYHNHIQTMEALLRLERTDELEKYLNEMKLDFASMEVIINTGNAKADAILNSKLSLMSNYNIAVDVTAIVPNKIPIKGTELSVLIGNILDNAIEACVKIEDESERFIRIYIDILKGQFYISVTNSMKDKAAMIGNRIISTKGTNNGFGLWSIDRIVMKYNGYINRQCEEGVFATEVLIPLEFDVL
jgi:sensor histidine kinase regulating citrate/malate metabolism